MHCEQPGELRTERNLSAFAALAALDGDHALAETDMLDPQGHELGDTGARFQQGLDHEAGLAVAGIGSIDEPELFLERQAGGCGASFPSARATRP